MEKKLGWAHKLGGAESLGISRVGQTVLARLMESQIWHQLASFVALWVEGLEKGQWLLLTLIPDTLVSPSMPLVPFKLLPWCCSSAGMSLSRWVHCVGSLRGTAWGSRSFFHWLNPHWFLQPEVVRTYLPGTGTLGWGAWCGAGTSHSQDISPEFLSTTHRWGTSLFCICAPPTHLDGCGFFNSIVVRLPFNSISDSSEWWLFYILVVILMWLCKEASLVCLILHLDGSPKKCFFKSWGTTSENPLVVCFGSIGGSSWWIMEKKTAEENESSYHLA